MNRIYKALSGLALGATLYLSPSFAEESCPKPYFDMYKMIQDSDTVSPEAKRSLESVVRKAAGRAKEAAQRIGKPYKDYTEEEVAQIFREIDSAIKEGFSIKRVHNLSDALERKTLDCDSASVIYCIVAQNCGFPIYIVYGRRHVYLRWDPDGKHNPNDPNDPSNKGDVNYEPLDGKTYPDEFYKTKSGGNLANLTDDQAKALVLAITVPKDPDKAIRQLETAASLDPENPIIHALMAQHYDNKGDVYAALKQYEKARNLDPNDGHICYLMAMALIKKGDYSSAFEACKKAAELLPDHAPSHALLADFYAQAGDLENAVKHAKHALSLDPHSPLARKALRIVNEKKGK